VSSIRSGYGQPCAHWAGENHQTAHSAKGKFRQTDSLPDFYLTVNFTVVECCRLPELPVVVIVYVPAGVPREPLRLVVVILSLEVAEVLPGVTMVGVSVQEEAAGTPEQVRETAEAKVPPSAVTVIV
jgi:hypothetical protein